MWIWRRQTISMPCQVDVYMPLYAAISSIWPKGPWAALSSIPPENGLWDFGCLHVFPPKDIQFRVWFVVVWLF